MAKVAINGFGRIGRLFLRQALESKDIDVVAINDLGDIENLAYLFKYDTVYGVYDGDVGVDGEKLVIGKKKIDFTQIKDPAELPWKDQKIDVVVEATGAFSTYEKSKAHIEAGAKRVVITAPSKDADGSIGKTILMGINDGELRSVTITSNGSCTTNAAAPVMSILSGKPGIEKAVLNTVHGYTAAQGIVDGPVRGNDFRKGRAAGVNIIPTTTGAAIAVSRVIPELEGKFDGIAFRVPVISGSVADVTFIAKNKTSVEEVNGVLKDAAKSPRWKGIFAVTEDQLVSSDIIGRPYGAIADLSFTKVVDGNLVKVLSWYDNELGYVSTLIKHVSSIAGIV